MAKALSLISVAVSIEIILCFSLNFKKPNVR
jgi:hypothetical protein